ncbi:hypothetical protein RFN69_14710 (plasmid) [Lactiplantibacillus plantarum]|nr:hypothetical protein [Lactiplantibacillus plantarum]MDR7678485.1 hypothetical protein [Lactiplantibacillus plantarum]
MGISRSYLNQLLNSKRPLTEAMRQRLTAAFRELSGITALNICFDYVRIRFPTHDVDELIVALFCIKPIYFVYEPYGRKRWFFLCCGRSRWPWWLSPGFKN